MTTKINPQFDIEERRAGSLQTWNAVRGKDLELQRTSEILADALDDINFTLNNSGGLLIRGFTNLKTPADFEQVMQVITPNLRDYKGGTSPREAVHGKVMEATRVPASWSIILHQEMAYTLNLPDRITFFCEVPAVCGGESTVGDMRLALDLIDPGIRERFDLHGLQLRRALPAPDRVHLKPGVQKPWTEVFGTDSKVEATLEVEAKGWRAEWTDDTLILWQDLLPAVRTHDVSGDPVWCNQAHFFSPACMMEWAKEDGREADYRAIASAREENPELLDYTCFGNGEPVDDASSLHVYHVLRGLEYPLALQSGDLLLLDNMLFSHGRKAFEGDRKICVVLADASDR